MQILDFALLAEELKKWKGCALYKTARAVPGEGNPHAKVMFIGEAPGEKEDELKRPFVGAAGKFFDELLQLIGLERSQVYISNAVKFRPPENRDPTPTEKEECLPWLQCEIALVQPRVLVPLGRHALAYFLKDITISDAHGKAFPLTKDCTIFPIYHPAAALHNGSLRSALAKDFYALGTFLEAHIA